MTKEQMDRWIALGFQFDEFTKDRAVATQNAEEDSVGEVYVGGYWSSDTEGKKNISNANLGETVYFHLVTKNIVKGTRLALQLFDDDGILFAPEDSFTTYDKSKPQKIIQSVTLNADGKATISLSLQESWAQMIETDAGLHIELFWKVYGQSFEKRTAATLSVGYATQYIYIRPPVQGYNLPELLNFEGEEIIFAAGSVLGAGDTVLEKIENCKYFIGARVLKKGKVITNIDEIYTRKVRIYKYNVYTNEGKELSLNMASNFGFKNKYVKNGQLVTSKGLSQIDYFSNKSVLAKVAKIPTTIIELWDIKELFDIMYKDDFEGDIPTSLIPTPLSFSYELISIMLIKPFVKQLVDELRTGLLEDFEIYKQKGLEACKRFIESPAGGLTKLKCIEVSTQVLNKLISNKYKTINELIKDEKDIPIHAVFYEETYDSMRGDDIQIINCIFINITKMNN